MYEKQHLIWYLSDGSPTPDQRVQAYDKFSTTYEENRSVWRGSRAGCVSCNIKHYIKEAWRSQVPEKHRRILFREKEVFREENSQSPNICAEVIGRYSTSDRENMVILDIGAGTGLVGQELYKLGFRIIDGIDPSTGMLEKAREKYVYRNLHCDFFTAKPTNINADTFDAICISAAFGKGDIPKESIYEMIRLGKSGCIICFVGRTVAFEEFFPLLEKLESDKLLKKEEIYETDKYRRNCPGLVLVYRVV